MSFSISKLLGSLPSHESAGWYTSMVVHAVGILAASTTWVAVSRDAPKLIGSRREADIAIQASWVEPPQPVAPVTIVPDEPPVLVTPTRVRIAQRTFVPMATDVSQPTPSELALVERMMALPSPRSQRRTTAELSETERPTPARVARRVRAAEIPTVKVHTAATAVQRTSIGADRTSPPRLLDNRPPTYPAQALVERFEGTVLLRVEVTPEGRVGSLEVLSSSGHPILDAAAVRAVRTWRFMPALQSGRPSSATVRLPVRFALEADVAAR